MKRFLDEDAHLIADNGSTADMAMLAGSMQGGHKQSFDLRMGYGRDSDSG